MASQFNNLEKAMKLGTNSDCFFAAWRKPCPVKADLPPRKQRNRASEPPKGFFRQGLRFCIELKARKTAGTHAGVRKQKNTEPLLLGKLESGHRFHKIKKRNASFPHCTKHRDMAATQKL